MMRKGGWRRATLTQADITVLVGLGVAGATVRAADYWTGEQARCTQTAVAVAEGVAPLNVWAWALAVGVVCLLIGWRQRRHALVFTGHLILGTVMSALTLGLIGSYLTLILHNGLRPEVFDGTRNITPLLTWAYLHSLLALRTGTHPLPREATVPAETVVKEAQ